jgi:hypothetical protein
MDSKSLNTLSVPLRPGVTLMMDPGKTREPPVEKPSQRVLRQRGTRENPNLTTKKERE